MTEEEFTAWLAPTMQGYADMNVEAGTWSPEEAPDLAAAEFRSYLPDGLATPDHHLSTLQDPSDSAGESVGVLWIHLRLDAGKPQAFVYDVAVNADKRSKGYGRAAMQACAQRARELGAQSVKLHVHGHNTVARSLYTSLGFIETDVMMLLPLDADAAS